MPSIKKGLFWTSLDRFATQLVQFVINIVIARIVSPSDYGTLAILFIFINIAQVFVDSGLGKALIQKHSVTKEDCSTVFYINFAISCLAYVLIWICAPYLADFYAMDDLTKLLRVVSLVLFSNMFAIVPQSLFSINLNFKPVAVANFISAIVSGIVGIYMAVKGFGIWALVGQTLSRSVLVSFIQIIQSKWMPTFLFSVESFKRLYSFGIKIFSSSLITNIVNELNSFVLGRLYPAKELGYYSRGTQFATMPFATITSIIYRVYFPALSMIKDDKSSLQQLSRKTIKYVSFITIPIMLWIVMIAKPLVFLLLTDKWLPCVPIIQIICVARMITIIAGLSVEIVNAIGRSDLTLKQDILKITVRVILLCATFHFGIVWVAVAELTSTVIHFFINTYYPGKFINYGALLQMRDCFPIFFSGLISIMIGFVSMYAFQNEIFQIFVSLVLAISSYVILTYLLERDMYRAFIRQITNKNCH